MQDQNAEFFRKVEKASRLSARKAEFLRTYPTLSKIPFLGWLSRNVALFFGFKGKTTVQNNPVYTIYSNVLYEIIDIIGDINKNYESKMGQVRKDCNSLLGKASLQIGSLFNILKSSEGNKEEAIQKFFLLIFKEEEIKKFVDFKNIENVSSKEDLEKWIQHYIPTVVCARHFDKQFNELMGIIKSFLDIQGSEGGDNIIINRIEKYKRLLNELSAEQKQKLPDALEKIKGLYDILGYKNTDIDYLFTSFSSIVNGALNELKKSPTTSAVKPVTGPTAVALTSTTVATPVSSSAAVFVSEATTSSHETVKKELEEIERGVEMVTLKVQEAKPEPEPEPEPEPKNNNAVKK